MRGSPRREQLNSRMNTAVIHRGLLGFSALVLLAGCASVVFPRQHEQVGAGPSAADQRIDQTSRSLAHYSMAVLEGYSGSDADAVQHYEAAIASDPEHVGLRMELAVAYFHQNRFDDMAVVLEEVLQRDPTNLRALQLSALGLRIQGRHREALIPLTRAATVEPKEAAHYLEIASVHARLKDRDEAIRTLEHALGKVDDRLGIYQALGELYLNDASAIRAKNRSAPLPKGPLEVLATATEAFPEDPYLLTQYGDLLILHRHIEEAIEVFARIEALSPDDLMIRQKLAVNLAAVGNRGKAIELLEQIAEGQPDNIRLLYYLAELYDQDEQPDKAREKLAAVIAINPNAPEAYIKLSFQLLARNQVAEALSLLLEARGEMPNDMRIVEMLGYAYAANTNHAEAAAQFSLVEDGIATTDRSPLMSNFYLNHAISLQLVGAYQDAADRLRTATATNPDAVEDYLSINLRSPNRADRITATLAVLDLIPDILPETVAFQTLHGMAAFQAEQPALALQLLEKAYARADEEESIDSLGGQFFFWLGAAAERTKDYDKAELYFLEAVRVEPGHADSHNYLAYMHAERGIKLDMAYHHIGIALDLEPDNAAFIDTRGWIYFHQGQYTNALADIQRAADLLPDDPTIADHLGDIHQALGQPEEARRWWSRALELDPANDTVRAKLETVAFPSSDRVDKDDEPESIHPEPEPVTE